MNKVLRWTAIIIGGVGAFTNLPALVTGFSLLRDSLRLHTSHGPYFNWPYLATASICLLFSALGLSMAIRAIWQQNFRILSSIVSLVLGLGCMVTLPNIGPRVDMAGAIQRLLGHADHSLSDWDEAHGRFPSNEEELRKALALRPLQEPAIFSLHGNPIPYNVRMVTNATGPSLETVPSNPGTVIYAVSSDYKEYWLTITTLRDPVAGPVALEHIAGLFELEPIWVMNRKHHNPGEGYQPFIE
jgi:hypothetical protein